MTGTPGYGDIRTTAAAWLATLLAAASLLPLVDDSDWLLQAGLLLAVVSGAGVLLRLTRLPAGLIALCQLLLSLVLLTAATASEYAVAGFLPSPAVFDRFGQLISIGADDIGRYSTPAPATTGIRLMVIGGVLLIGLLVDLLSGALRNAAAAGLPLLALYSVAAGVGQGAAGWSYFGLAAAGYLLLLLSEGRERVTRWGLFFGSLGGGRWMTARDHAQAAGPRLRSGRRIGAVTLGVALLAPTLLPTLDEGLLDLNGDGGANNAAGVAVNPVVALQDQLNQPQNLELLSHRTDFATPSDIYLRLVALDQFNGTQWASSEWHEDDAPPAPWAVPGLSPEVAVESAVTEIEASAAYAQRSLPVPYPAISVRAEGDWSFDRGSQTLVSHNSSLTTSGLRYRVEHLVVTPTREQLAGAPEPREDFQEYYTRVPDTLPQEVAATAEEVTAGTTNHYERAVALQEWFTSSGGFRYDTTVESGSGNDAIVNFLNQKEGFCVHFAFTMASMARTLGIPSQVAVGFTPGRATPGGYYQVGAHNAHAWPELYFEGVGWVRFEPTPGQGNAPGYTLPERVEPDDGPTPEPEPSERPEPTEPSPSPSPTTPDRCDPAVDGNCGDEPVTPEQDRDEAGFAFWPLAWGGGGLLLALVLAGPLLWRARQRARRLRPDAGPLGAWRELTASAWDYGITPVASETPRQTAERIIRVAKLPPESAAGVRELATAVEAELYAPPEDRAPSSAGYTPQITAARTGLATDLPLLTRLRARLLPRSTPAGG
ncbi:transglutaminase TgpA family protein [Streptomyces profundus]|uniref:transglutaminase TgpA family protein n=1 Tax=Streptomyces profundus TaxID=2867410 RepID=UPI001D163EC7|nr:DUF3488 and transglutaminase-like domain-containing protein [Streptomyces sp. MA3_2.13]UED83690.1 DUF3488 and transglutaminase-like domain-containing protein [Streptomyces sp. MA3_2.13]